MTAILVTGGAGFIGSHVVDALLQRGHRVVAFDSFHDYYSPARKRRNLAAARQHPQFHLVEGDIRDAAAVERTLAENRVESIVHLAAMVGIRNSIAKPVLYADVNVLGLGVVLDAAQRHGVRSIVFTSSSSVYGVDTPPPFAEDAPATSPISPYAATKRAGEMLCRTYHTLYGTTITCLRLFTVYGPRGRPDMAPYRFVERVLSGQPLPVFGDGSTTRDYTYVGDVVTGILSALEIRSGFEIINVGSGVPVSLADLIRVVEEIAGRQAVIERGPPRSGDVPHTFASLDKAARLLGYRPTVSIADGMRRFVEWYRAESKEDGPDACAR